MNHPAPRVRRSAVGARRYPEAVADANGLTAADVLPHATETMASMPDFLSFYAPRIDAGRHGGDVDRLTRGMTSIEHVLHTSVEAGVDTALPAAVADLFRRGMDAGHAADSFSSLVELMKRPAGRNRPSP